MLKILLSIRIIQILHQMILREFQELEENLVLRMVLFGSETMLVMVTVMVMVLNGSVGLTKNHGKRVVLHKAFGQMVVFGNRMINNAS
jgi:hypothetical protein